MLVLSMISAGTTGTEEPPGITALSCAALPDAAGQLEQIGERDAQRHLEVAGLVHVSRDRKDHRAARVLRPEIGEPLRALAQDGRHRGIALGVVDRGRRAIEAEGGRKRRLEARLAGLALERIEQRRLLAADVGAGADEGIADRNRRPSPGCSCRAGPPRRLPAAPPRSAAPARREIRRGCSCSRPWRSCSSRRSPCPRSASAGCSAGCRDRGRCRARSRRSCTPRTSASVALRGMKLHFTPDRKRRAAAPAQPRGLDLLDDLLARRLLGAGSLPGLVAADALIGLERPRALVLAAARSR